MLKNEMKKRIDQKKAGYLFILSGLMFAVAGLMDESVAFGGVAMMFIILGMVYIKNAKKNETDE